MTKIKVVRPFWENFFKYNPGAVVPVSDDAAARWQAQGLVEIVESKQPEFATSPKSKRK